MPFKTSEQALENTKMVNDCQISEELESFLKENFPKSKSSPNRLGSVDKNFSQNILIGYILIRNGEIETSQDGYFDICKERVFVSDTFIENIDCDLYILTKNRYYAMNTYKEFVENIETDCNFIYINSIGLSDANVYMGGSFAKNSDNEIVLQMPRCKEYTDTVDFSRNYGF